MYNLYALQKNPFISFKSNKQTSVGTSVQICLVNVNLPLHINETKDCLITSSRNNSLLEYAVCEFNNVLFCTVNN